MESGDGEDEVAGTGEAQGEEHVNGRKAECDEEAMTDCELVHLGGVVQSTFSEIRCECAVRSGRARTPVLFEIVS